MCAITKHFKVLGIFVRILSRQICPTNRQVFTSLNLLLIFQEGQTIFIILMIYIGSMTVNLLTVNYTLT